MEGPLVKGETTVLRARLRLSHLAATDFAFRRYGVCVPMMLPALRLN
jgi:hypothetical protein